MDTLRFWQNKLFSLETDPTKQGKVNPNNRKADVYRALLNTVYASRAIGEERNNDAFLSEGAAKILASKLTDFYAACVDDISGINNFADGALAMSKGKNDSKNWTTSLPQSEGELENYVKEICGDIRQNELDKVDEKDYEDLWKTMLKLKAEKYTGTNAESCRRPQSPGVENTPTNSNPIKLSSGLATKAITNYFQPSPKENRSSSMVNTNPVQEFINTKIARDPSSTITRKNIDNSNPLPRTNQNAGNSWFQTLHHSTFDRSTVHDKRPRDNAVNMPSTEVTGIPDDPAVPTASYCTARDQYIVDQQKKKSRNTHPQNPAFLYESRVTKKSLGTRRGPSSKFVPPIANQCLESPGQSDMMLKKPTETENDKLKNIDPKMVELMMNEILDHGPPVTWDDIAGLEFAKNTILEIVVWPMLRPDIFSGLRGPPKGLLLFGPPGTGKTLIGKCIASQAKATFFCISASSLTSKWVGEGEKLVKALFMTARCFQPAVIFIDEIDSLLSQRSDSEHESSRRIKTEFLVQLDGASTQSDERLLIVGATNRPQELDEAARRRLVKRLYIPLPTLPARKQIIKKLLSTHHHVITDEELDSIGVKTEGYSGADMTNLCKEAALGPIRDLNFSQIERISPDQVRPIVFKDFITALKHIRASVSDRDLSMYEEWNNRYGSGGF